MNGSTITRERFYFAVAATTLVLAGLRLNNGDAGMALALGVIGVVLLIAAFLSRTRD